MVVMAGAVGCVTIADASAQLFRCGNVFQDWTCPASTDDFRFGIQTGMGDCMRLAGAGLSTAAAAPLSQAAAVDNPCDMDGI